MYFQVINDPLQQLVAKKGGGRIFERLGMCMFVILGGMYVF